MLKIVFEIVQICCSVYRGKNDFSNSRLINFSLKLTIELIEDFLAQKFHGLIHQLDGGSENWFLFTKLNMLKT